MTWLGKNSAVSVRAPLIRLVVVFGHWDDGPPDAARSFDSSSACVDVKHSFHGQRSLNEDPLWPFAVAKCSQEIDRLRFPSLGWASELVPV